MHDVAQLAGVSQSTVSRVLNETSSTVPISEETRQRILAAVEQLHYQPNMIARSLRTLVRLARGDAPAGPTPSSASAL